MNFADCEFKHCDLSLVKLKNSVLRDVTFTGCKLLGVHFEECNKFGFSAKFERCQVKLSSFYKLSLKEAVFKECDLQEVDFTETNLTAARLEQCDLSRAIFKNTVLEKADLRTSYNYSIDPETNRIKKAKFSFTGIAGLLDKYNIVIE
jgi:uncharacterized protein YjbI with pentapeptide repeats